MIGGLVKQQACINSGIEYLPDMVYRLVTVLHGEGA